MAYLFIFLFIYLSFYCLFMILYEEFKEEIQIKEVKEIPGFPFAYGRALINQKAILMRKDNPWIIKSFIKGHEIFHVNDKEKHWLKREIKANIFSGIIHPIGFISTILLTLTSKQRIQYYIQRFKEKK